MAVEKLETELQQDASSQVSSLHKERPFKTVIYVLTFVKIFLVGPFLAWGLPRLKWDKLLPFLLIFNLHATALMLFAGTVHAFGIKSTRVP